MGNLTNFPNGVSSFGVPVMGSGSLIPVTTGTYFHVNSGHTNAANTNVGTDPSYPLATIDAAVGKCTASAGDVIIVAPGHAETISAATSLVADVAGIAIIGLGWGRLRPTLTFSATASRIPISADNVLISNLVLVASIASIVSGVTVTGDDVTLDQIEIDLDETGVEFLQMLDIDAAARATVQNCRLIAENIAGCNTGIRVDATTYLRIINTEIRGDFTTAAISGNAGTGAASTDAAIVGCRIENLDTTAGLCIDMHDDSTGIISDNRLFTLFATAPETAFDPGACLVDETYVVNAIDESGTICPTVLST